VAAERREGTRQVLLCAADLGREVALLVGQHEPGRAGGRVIDQAEQERGQALHRGAQLQAAELDGLFAHTRQRVVEERQCEGRPGTNHGPQLGGGEDDEARRGDCPGAGRRGGAEHGGGEADRAPRADHVGDRGLAIRAVGFPDEAGEHDVELRQPLALVEQHFARPEPGQVGVPVQRSDLCGAEGGQQRQGRKGFGARSHEVTPPGHAARASSPCQMPEA
jgi:hypothetical protein